MRNTPPSQSQTSLPPAAEPPSPGARNFPGWPPSFEAALERLALAPRQLSRQNQPGSVRSRVRGRALEFADYRPYVPGDDPRLVDWRTYARLDRLYLKQFEEEHSRALTLLVDASASMDWGTGDEHKGYYARRLAAALAWISLSRHEPVRVFLLREGTATRLRPVSVRAGIGLLFQELGSAKEAGRTDLVSSLRAAFADTRPGPTVLLSDLLEPGWAEAGRLLAATREGCVLQVLAPSEWEPPLGEEVELEDSETGNVRSLRLGPLELAAYRDRLAAFLHEVRDACQRLGVLHLALNSGAPLQETVLRALPRTGVLA